ncbi:MAG: RNA polymerase sigma factor, partial [Planctomycetota bacterium]
DRGVCEELVQEVFVEAYFSLSHYRGEAAFMHWLSRIATRVGYRLWKKQKQEKQYVQIMDFDGLAEEDDLLEAAQASEILHRLLARLPRADRLVLTLMYFENCSTDEIARRMGWNRAMVKMRAYRARKKIKIIAEKEKLLEQLRWTH